MAVDGVTVSSSTGIDGNTYTSQVDNGQLTTDDFLTLMLEELKLQDPTKPMDSQRMLDTQMQMTGIETNLATIEAMTAMQTAFNQSAFSNAANVIGRNIENGNTNQAGVNSAFTVRSIESVDGEIQVKAQEILFLETQVTDASGNIINYDLTGNILDENGNTTGDKIALSEPGTPLVSDGVPVVLDDENVEITDHDYGFSGISIPVYSDQLTTLPFESITKIF